MALAATTEPSGSRAEQGHNISLCLNDLPGRADKKHALPPPECGRIPRYFPKLALHSSHSNERRPKFRFDKSGLPCNHFREVNHNYNEVMTKASNGEEQPNVTSILNGILLRPKIRFDKFGLPSNHIREVHLEDNEVITKPLDNADHLEVTSSLHGTPFMVSSLDLLVEGLANLQLVCLGLYPPYEGTERTSSYWETNHSVNGRIHDPRKILHLDKRRKENLRKGKCIHDKT